VSTSGTIGQTLITVSKLIEHAVRRCGLAPSTITHETMQVANENLYLLMLALANEGLNLWCVETNYVGLVTNKSTYAMPVGTINVLNLQYSMPSRSEGTDTSGATSFTTELDDETAIVRVGLKFSTIAATDTIVIANSTDGIGWTTIDSITRSDWAADEWYWIPLDPVVSDVFFRITSTNPITVDEFYLANAVYDQYIYKYNRDDYMNLPNKQTLGRPSTNYYYERKTTPQVSLWPIPNNEFDHLTIVRHRQIQDIGKFTNQIELPERWLEAIIWQLAERLCFELPDVRPERVSMVQLNAAKNLITVGNEETDGATIRLASNIRGYTR
jgi:hypothetical protein